MADVNLGPLAAIMAQQRSGTHMLGSCIGSHPNVKYTGEIFCRNVPTSWARLVDTVKRVECGGWDVIVLDVKYNQISPPVEQLLREIPVIHLLRQDERRLYFSGQLHSYWGSHPKDKERGFIPTLAFHQPTFDAIMYARQWAIQKFSYLEDLRLVYEDLTDNQEVTELPAWACRRICETLGVEYRILTTDYKKNAPRGIEQFLT